LTHVEDLWVVTFCTAINRAEGGCPQGIEGLSVHPLAPFIDLQDLWKIRAPVATAAQGFDLQKFDDVIMAACDEADLDVEPQPLWWVARSSGWAQSS
jgi:hypothetical protein